MMSRLSAEETESIFHSMKPFRERRVCTHAVGDVLPLRFFSSDGLVFESIFKKDLTVYRRKVG